MPSQVELFIVTKVFRLQFVLSKVVKKDDFYSFINAGNNIIRDMEDAGMSVAEGKKYLSYLTKHNIM